MYQLEATNVPANLPGLYLFLSRHADVLLVSAGAHLETILVFVWSLICHQRLDEHHLIPTEEGNSRFKLEMQLIP